MAYVRYAWVANRISESDMAALYKMKTQTRRPITKLVAEAVGQYVREATPVMGKSQRRPEK